MSPGQTVVFLLLGVLNVLVAFWVFGYAACWFLYVLDRTTTGTNQFRVRWPEDDFARRTGKLLHLAFLAAVWALPVLVFFHYVEWPLRPELEPPFVVLVVGVVLWLALPVSLLSSMTSASHGEFFRLTVLVCLVRGASVWLAFYVYTLPLLVGCALVVYLALFGTELLREEAAGSALPWLPDAVDVWAWAFVLPVTAVMFATATLVYARLLGRLAWLLGFGEDEEDAAPGPAPRVPAAVLASEHDVLESRTATDDAPVECDVIGFADEPGLTAEARPVPESPPLPVPLPDEPPPPRRLWVRGIYLFPWYRGTLLAWLVLTLGGLILGALVRLQVLQLRG